MFYRKHACRTVSKDNLSDVAMRYYKDLRKRSGRFRHARMIRAKNFRPAPIKPTPEEFDMKRLGII